MLEEFPHAAGEKRDTRVGGFLPVVPLSENLMSDCYPNPGFLDPPRFGCCNCSERTRDSTEYDKNLW